MLVTTLRQARATAGRLVAAGLAIALGAAFVAAVLLATGLMQRTIFAAVSTDYTGADVVVSPGRHALGPADLAAIRALPQVAGADGRLATSIALVAGAASEDVEVASVPTTQALRPATKVGRLPSGAGQVTLDPQIADRLGVSVGARLVARTYAPPSSDTPDAEPVVRDRSVRVVGLLKASGADVFSSSSAAYADPADTVAWAQEQGQAQGQAQGQEAVSYPVLLAVAHRGTSPDALRADISRALSGRGATVRTADEQSAKAVDAFASGTNVLTGILLAFAALALFVAAIVITNTFAVLVAQRTRALALLRCVGATRGQVRGGILAEAAALGLVASCVGVALGTGLAAVAARILSQRVHGLPVPSTVAVSAASILVPVALGTVVTVLAALAPAHAATAVSPLAALRPPMAPDLSTRTSRVRLVASVGLMVVGAAMLAGGVALSLARSGSGGLLIALPGGALSFVGVMIGAVFIVPGAVGAGGRLAALVGGGPARVAAANAVRNPRRTTATTSALLIGVTLVSLMTVGAATTRATLNGALEESYPVDVAIGDDAPYPSRGAQEVFPGPAALPAGTAGAVKGVRGVAAVVPVRSAVVAVGAAADGVNVAVEGVDPGRARSVLAAPHAADALAPGVAVVPQEVARLLRVRSGGRLTLAGVSGSRTLRVAVSSLRGTAVLITPADLGHLASAAPTTRLWLSLDRHADAVVVVDRVRRAVGQGLDTAPAVSGSAVERASYEKVIDTMLAVVVALLAVAVVIALIGVANTLSLSVIERTRESAVMRAVGLTRGQLRGMLALEGVLMAGAGGVLGVILGSVYGWAGATTLLGDQTRSSLAQDVPWRSLALIIMVALLAGLLASVLPARRAVRTPPVAALAE